jgi:hypothetical protein
MLTWYSGQNMEVEGGTGAEGYLYAGGRQDRAAGSYVGPAEARRKRGRQCDL